MPLSPARRIPGGLELVLTFGTSAHAAAGANNSNRKPASGFMGTSISCAWVAVIPRRRRGVPRRVSCSGAWREVGGQEPQTERDHPARDQHGHPYRLIPPGMSRQQEQEINIEEAPRPADQDAKRQVVADVPDA